MSYKDCIKVQEWTYLHVATALKAEVLPHVGLDCMLIIADYESKPYPVTRAGHPEICSYEGCGAKHRRRISAFCNEHADTCIWCGVGKTGGPRKLVCPRCLPKRAAWGWLDELAVASYGSHNLYWFWHGRMQWMSEWARDRGIQWGGPYMLAETKENQRWVKFEVWSTYNWNMAWIPHIDPRGWGILEEYDIELKAARAELNGLRAAYTSRYGPLPYPPA